MIRFALEQTVLADIAFRSSVLLALTAGVAFALGRRSAAFVHAVWTVGLAASLAIPAVMSLSPSWNLALLPPQSIEVASPPAPQWTDTANDAAVAPSDRIRGRQAIAVSSSILSQEAAISPVATPLHRRSSPPTAVVDVPVDTAWLSMTAVGLTIWATGFLIVLLRLIQQVIAVRRKLYQSRDLESSAWRQQKEVAARQLGLHSKVTLKRHPEAVSPMVIGLFRPVIVLPGDADEWSPEGQHLALLHELSHVQRRDVLTQTMAALACAVYWFNPLVWWGALQMKRLREIACDDAVVTQTSDVSAYAQTLLEVAKRYRCQPASAVAMARSSDVEGRISAILSSTRNRTRLSARTLRILASMAMLAAAFIGTCQIISRAGESKESPSDETATAEHPNGERTLVVKVLNQEGQPLEDANLHVSIWELDGARDYGNRDFSTDGQGRAEVAIPRRLKILRMWPAKEGYVPLFVNFADGKHQEGRLIPDEYEFRLQKGHRLSGRVVDEQGQPIAGAKVQVKVDVDEPAWGAHPEPMLSTWLTDSDFHSPTPVTDSEGRWSISNAPAPPKGSKKDFKFSLQVTHPEYAGDTQWGELQQQQGMTTAELRAGSASLVLKPGVAVSGQVTGPDGESVRKGLVIWNARPYWAEGVNETQIDESGHYSTQHLAPGKYPITVLAPGFSPWQTQVDVQSGMDDLNISLEAGHPIRIQFVDQQGEPIPDVYVGIGEWRGTEAIFNTKHPNVPESGVPRHGNDIGVYEWDWAPADVVEYRFSQKGYAPRTLALAAKPEPHVILLSRERIVSGNVTDSTTGKPVKNFEVMPVIVFGQDFYHTRTSDAKVGRDGRYEVLLTGAADENVRYRVRFEADGYRSVVSEESFGPRDGHATLDFELEPAPARPGRVVDAKGRPVADATVVEASPTDVPMTSNTKPDSYDSRPIQTGSDGTFQLRATTEPVLVRAYHKLGFAEKELAPGEKAIGELKLQPWASVSGRLLQAGRPVGNEWIYFTPINERGLLQPRFQDSFSARTDADGHFEFDRLPPIAGRIRAHLGPWEDSPLTSSESIPLKLSPGEHRDVVLGGEGATITGRVVATGRSNDEFSKQWSLNYLVSRDDGIHYPEEASPLSFRPAGALQADWLTQSDFSSWLATRRNHFVKLSEDGQLDIHGVAAGAYDLVIQLYEQPAGCLVETIGEKVVPVVVTAEDANSGRLDIGDIEVQCRIGPRIGSNMRAFQFTDANGQRHYVDDLQGQYVLFHVWASWCTPCVASMPSLAAAVEQHSDSPLSVVGLNVDDDAAAAAEMAKTHGLNWAQNYLGSDSDMMRQLAVSSVPAYYLIGPDGRLVGSSNEWEPMRKLLEEHLE